MNLTKAQFAEHFNDRLRMLMRSAAAYDEGEYAEATRLAGTIVKLIGDRIKKTGETNKNFISLSSRLGIKPPEMIDSSLVDAMNHPHLHGPLCIMGFHLSGANGLVPILNGFERENIGPLKTMPFDLWWNAPVIRDCRGNEFSRRMIVETMRDQEDAHTDGDLNPEYAEVAYNGAIGIVQINQNAVVLDMNPARIVVRQITHEILRTFVPNLPAQFIQTKGLLVQPLMLYEIMKKGEDGQFIQVLDHKAFEFRAEITSNPEIWHEWEHFIGIGSGVNNLPPEKTSNWRLRIALLNYAPYPIEGLQVKVSMPSPAS